MSTIFFVALFRRFGSLPNRNTARPAEANTAAIPDPIRPVPTTPTRKICEEFSMREGNKVPRIDLPPHWPMAGRLPMDLPSLPLPRGATEECLPAKRLLLIDFVRSRSRDLCPRQG